MKLKILMLAVVGVMLSVCARAEFYISAGLGAAKNTGNVTKTIVNKDYETSPIYSLAVGYDLPFVDIVRVEGEYLHNRAKLKNGLGYVNFDAAMANGYVDIPFVLPLITPYVGAGIGVARMENSTVMPYQLMLGLDGEIFVLPIVGSLEYRYLKTNKEASSAQEKDKYYNHVLMAKIRYEF